MRLERREENWGLKEREKRKEKRDSEEKRELELEEKKENWNLQELRELGLEGEKTRRRVTRYLLRMSRHGLISRRLCVFWVLVEMG
jgi:hypothetical protein